MDIELDIGRLAFAEGAGDREVEKAIAAAVVSATHALLRSEKDLAQAPRDGAPFESVTPRMVDNPNQDGGLTVATYVAAVVLTPALTAYFVAVAKKLGEASGDALVAGMKKKLETRTRDTLRDVHGDAVRPLD